MPENQNNISGRTTKQSTYPSFINSRLSSESESPQKPSKVKFEESEKLSPERRETKFSSTLKDFREMRLERQLQNSRSPRKQNVRDS